MFTVNSDGFDDHIIKLDHSFPTAIKSYQEWYQDDQMGIMVFEELIDADDFDELTSCLQTRKLLGYPLDVFQIFDDAEELCFYEEDFESLI
jgi:hypothetical protein